MSKTLVRNKLHQEGLDTVKSFIQSGGVVTRAESNYKTQEWKAERPRHRQIKGDSK